MTQNNVRFELIEGDALDHLCDQSIGYLTAASASLYSYLEVPISIQQAKDHFGLIYEVYLENKLTGCFFLNFVQASVGKTMNLILLGGENLSFWSEALSKFLNQLALDTKVDEFTALGRRGLRKVFPELEHFACLYRKRFTEI